MIIKLLPICYQPDHSPCTSIKATHCQTVDSEKPASKLIRAVLRVSEMDPNTWTQYSIHRCDCKSKGKGKEEDEVEDELDSSKTLDQSGIREGDAIFFRKRSDRMEELEDDRMEELEEDQKETSSSLSRKRKQRDEDEATSQSSLPPAPTPKSNLENLTPQAATTARSISKLLGGEGWKTQSIGKLGLIPTRSKQSLQALSRAVKMSLQLPQVVPPEAGFFNPDLVEALTRAYHQRVRNPKKHGGGEHLENLSLLDYEKANELLKGKIEQDGSWEKSSISHLDESALSKPAFRFPLSDSGLSGQPLSAARAICILWNNDKWLSQAPLPGLSPISLKDERKNSLLRQIAELTRVRPGEATPDGFPPIVLRALKQAIQQRIEESGSSTRGSRFGWCQFKDIAQALEILKRDLKSEEMAPSTSSASSSVNKRSNKKANRSLN